MNNTKIDMKKLEGCVIDVLKKQILSAERIEQVIQLAHKGIMAALKKGERRTDALEREIREVEQRIDRLVDAIMEGKARIESIESRLAELEARKNTIEKELTEAQRVRMPVTIEGLEERIRRKLEEPVGILREGALQKMRDFFRMVGLEMKAYADKRVFLRANLAPAYSGSLRFVYSSGAGNRI